MNLAEQCYASTNVSDKLFDEVNKILGCDTKQCLEEGFKWAVNDVFWDEYDWSIEIIRPEDSTWMTQEQANKIITDLGFSMIYESIGDQAVIHYRNISGGKCEPREADETLRLRATIKALRETINTLKANK